jgi:hypothetical protein
VRLLPPTRATTADGSAPVCPYNDEDVRALPRQHAEINKPAHRLVQAMSSIHFESKFRLHKVRQDCFINPGAQVTSVNHALTRRSAGQAALLLATRESVAGPAAANSSAAAENVDERALRLQVRELSSTQR